MFENYSLECLQLFKEAENQRQILHHEYVGTEHLLLAILKNDLSLSEVFNQFNLDYNSFFQEVKSTLNPIRKKVICNIYTPLLKKVIYATTKEEKMDGKSLFFHILDEGEGVAIRILLSMGVDVDALYSCLKNKIHVNNDLTIYKTGKLLNNYIDLNEKVVGRDKEINLIIETLLRKKKNNPLLIGEAGVGKSAIVEELTRRIIKGDVPDKLLNMKIVMLEMGSLVSGTKYRGEFEEKLTKIVSELIDNQDIILFIDEIHTLSSAGAAEGAICAADILKPYLARGNIKCIGATTKQEYEKYLLKDKALCRRFEPILVKEPNEEETFNILKNIKDEYVAFHKISISDELLKAIIHLTNTYFPNKYNPDKSIELLDSVMAYVRLKTKHHLINAKEEELKKIETLKIRDVEYGNFKSALKNNMRENEIRKELNALKNNKKISVTSEDIMDVLEFKNNLILHHKKIKNIKYDKNAISIINKSMTKNGVKSFLLINPPEHFCEDVAQELSYEFIKLTSEKSLEKMFNRVKYYPSMVIMVNEDESYVINETLKKIYQDGLFEYNDEFINFQNTIIFINAKAKKIGFNHQEISNIPVDEIISFKQIKSPII